MKAGSTSASSRSPSSPREDGLIGPWKGRDTYHSSTCSGVMTLHSSCMHSSSIRSLSTDEYSSCSSTS